MTEHDDAVVNRRAAVGRRALSAGAAAGVAGTVLAARATPASAATSSIGWYDVTDYGGKGDNTTDDTDAIQNAVTACGESGGGVVYLPAGARIPRGVGVGGRHRGGYPERRGRP